MSGTSHHTAVPEPVETLRSLFKRAHDDLNMNTSQLSALLKEKLGIVWPYRELRRFVYGQTRNTRRPLHEIQAMTGVMRDAFHEAGQTTQYLMIPLTPAQKTAIDAGLVDQDRLIDVMLKDMREQLVAIAKATAKPETP